jgi:hypothetical protein
LIRKISARRRPGGAPYFSRAYFVRSPPNFIAAWRLHGRGSGLFPSETDEMTGFFAVHPRIE